MVSYVLELMDKTKQTIIILLLALFSAKLVYHIWYIIKFGLG